MDIYFLQRSICPKCKEREESHAHFIFYCKLPKATLDFISELIYLNWSFNIPLKISLKAIIMGASSRFHGSVQLKTLPTLLEVFLAHLSFCRRKAFHDDGYDKINELFNFKHNLVSCFNKIRDTATELDSKETFLKSWNSFLNNNGKLNIQFN